MYQDDNSFATGYAVGRDSNNNGYGNGMFGGDWAWILIFALLFGWGRGGFGGGFGGFGENGFISGYDLGKVATTNDVAVGFNNSAVLSSLNDLKLGQAGLQQTLCQGFSGINSAINTNGYETRLAVNGLSAQLADCCCGIQRGIDAVNYNMATNTCTITNAINNSTRDIIDNQNANYRAIHDELVANKIEAKNDRIAELQQQVTALQFSASQQAQNAFITANQEAQTAELIRRLGRDCPVPAFVVPNPNCCYPTNYNSCGCNSCGY